MVSVQKNVNSPMDCYLGVCQEVSSSILCLTFFSQLLSFFVSHTLDDIWIYVFFAYTFESYSLKITVYFTAHLQIYSKTCS